MIPLIDTGRIKRVPVLTLLIILVTTLVFIYQFSLDATSLDAFVGRYALVPSQVNFGNPSTLLPFITAIFLHGSWWHLGSNMLFLWVFGDNIEAQLGKWYVPFYLLGGIIGNIVQYFIGPGSTIPVLGASGAIAAVLGAYWLLFPRNTIKTLIFLVIFITIINIRARYLLLFWFITQLFNGLSVITHSTSGSSVAYFAHIGGFIAGALLVRLLVSRAALQQLQSV